MKKRMMCALLATLFVCGTLAGCEKSTDQKLKDSESALAEKYASIIGGIQDFQDDVASADGIPDFPLEAAEITQSQVDDLDKGSSYQSVLRLLSASIDEDVPDNGNFDCHWNGENGAFVLLSFSKGKLFYKSYLP